MEKEEQSVSEKLVEKVIGAAYVVHNDNFFAADVYEGNYYKIMEGNTVKLYAFPKKEYERVLTQYEECVKNESMIISAYEMNKRANHSFEIPTVTADPEAANKEWYIRKHPQVVPVVEPVKKKRSFFLKKEKEGIGIKCLNCGMVHKDGQKFCGECGAKLLSAQDEITQGSSMKDIGISEGTDKGQNLLMESQEMDFMENAEEVLQDKSMEKSEEEKQSKRPYVKSTMEMCGDVFSDEDKKEREHHSIVRNTKSTKEENLEEAVVRRLKKKKNTRTIVWFLLAVFILMFGMITMLYLFFSMSNQNILYNSENDGLAEVFADSKPVESINSGYIVIKLKNDVTMNEQIMADDLEGTILNKEQYEKYNGISTYIDENGETKEEKLLFWEDREQVIGKYASRDLESGSILYDTFITSKHVVADKTFVEVEVDGQSNTYQATTEVLPGNTKIQIVAIVKTDGVEPKQILLSEMTLQDRSLESIFDSAGQDILNMLSEKSRGEEIVLEEVGNLGEEVEQGREDEVDE